MDISKRQAFWCSVISIFLTGCAVLDKFYAPSLEGSPSASSVILVETEVIMHGAFDIITSQQVQSGALLRNDRSKIIYGKAVGSLIIFSDVPPGEYNLALIEATWRQGTLVIHHTYNIPPEKVINYSFSVKAGEPKYLGVVTVKDLRKFSERGIVFGIKVNKKTEVAAWEKFNQMYDDSPWVIEVKKRLSELKQ